MSFILLGILNSQALGAAATAGAYDLLETETLAGTQTTVSFSSLSATYGSDYESLQMRITARTNRASVADLLRLQFNSDATANYSMHQLYNQTATVYSYAQSSLNYIEVERVAGGNTTANDYGGMVLDILEPFSSSKATTIRAVSGIASNYYQVTLSSGAWFNTNAISTIDCEAIGDWVAGSRFSLYGRRKAA